MLSPLKQVSTFDMNSKADIELTSRLLAEKVTVFTFPVGIVFPDIVGRFQKRSRQPLGEFLFLGEHLQAVDETQRFLIVLAIRIDLAGRRTGGN